MRTQDMDDFKKDLTLDMLDGVLYRQIAEAIGYRSLDRESWGR